MTGGVRIAWRSGEGALQGTEVVCFSQAESVAKGLIFKMVFSDTDHQ